MLIDLDQNTLANMTAALEHTCKRLPPKKDTAEARKKIADALIARAKSGNRGYADLENAGAKVLKEILRPQSFDWFVLRQ
jgi:hypothetical protein